MTVKFDEGNITANPRMLNLISIAFMEAARKYEDVGCDVLAQDAQEKANKIYDALHDARYFKKALIYKPLRERLNSLKHFFRRRKLNGKRHRIF